VIDGQYKVVLDTVDDLVQSFLYHDRSEDEYLTCGEIESMIESQEISIKTIVERFAYELERSIADA